MRHKVLLSLMGCLALAAWLPFFFNVAGDAQVHLAIAEMFTRGMPFQYNPDGPRVVASTSPFWTILLVVMFSLFGAWAAVALKVCAFLCLAACSWLVVRQASSYLAIQNSILKVFVITWLFCTPILANGLSGLENIVGMLQMLLIFGLLMRWVRKPSNKVIVGLGFLQGWAILTRPDVGFFAMLTVICVFGIHGIQHRNQSKIWFYIFQSLVLIGAIAVCVLIPWYTYQYIMTGSLVTDSSLARMYAGRRTSLMLIPGYLYFHPKVLVSLFTFFLPLSIGTLLRLASLLKNKIVFQECKIQFGSKLYATVVSAFVLGAGILFYTFVVGADHFGRYFLPLYPFLFFLGFSGLQITYKYIRTRSGKAATGFICAVLVYLLTVSAADYYRRVRLKRQFRFNLSKVVNAPANRKPYTDRLLERLNADEDEHTRIAVTEVQLRYFVDDRVFVISLDGRTSANILNYMEPETGLPDFALYLEDEKPDYIALGQWRRSSGWTRLLFPTLLPDNLLGKWEKKVNSMDTGDSFDWNGRKLTYVGQNMLHISWDSSS